MLLYLYGLPGVGKNYIGKIFEEQFKFYFQDADKYLPFKMKKNLQRGEHFTKKDVKNYHYIIAKKLYHLSKKYNNLIISQASLFKDHRQIIKDKNPLVEFIYIKSDRDTIINRINKAFSF